MKPWVVVVAIVLGGVLVAGCGSGSDAKVYTDDAKFYGALEHDGVPHDGDIWAAAKKVCQQMREQGQTAAYEIAVVAAVQRPAVTVNDTPAAMYTPDQARMFVNESIAFYCPEFTSQMVK